MAESSNQVFKSEINDWIMDETRGLDVVASWESLCDTYRVLEFVDPISDSVRLEEYKWIIREMNKHLTRSRKKLMTCQDIDSMIDLLTEMFTPTGEVKINGRRELAYQKLRQRWILQMISGAQAIREQMLERQIQEGSEDGWRE